MKNWIVSFIDDDGYGFAMAFQADDVSHAVEQARDATETDVDGEVTDVQGEIVSVQEIGK